MRDSCGSKTVSAIGIRGTEETCENCELLVAAECHNDGDRATGGFKVAFSLDGGTPQLEEIDALGPDERYWFYGPQDEESLGTPTLGDSDLDAASLLRCPNVYLKPTGYVHLMAVPTAGGPHEGADIMEQTHRYALTETPPR